MSPFPLVPAYVPTLLSEVEQEQRPSGNGDRESIVVRAGLCDGEVERAYTAYAPHDNIFASRTNVFSFLEDVSGTETFRSNSTAFHSVPAIRSKDSTSVLSTRRDRPIYSHPTVENVPFNCYQSGTYAQHRWLKDVKQLKSC